MELTFYEKTGGVTLLVIRHKGSKFDYVNGFHGNDYFPKWDPFIPFMEQDKFYVIACDVKIKKNSKASLTPIGIVFECENEKQAKAISYEHRAEVENMNWDADLELPKLKEDWAIYKQFHFKRMAENVEKSRKPNIKTTV